MNVKELNAFIHECHLRKQINGTRLLAIFLPHMSYAALVSEKEFRTYGSHYHNVVISDCETEKPFAVVPHRGEPRIEIIGEFT